MMGENILRKIGERHVAEALRTLPHAETSTRNFQEIVFKLPVFGQVRLTCERMTRRYGQNRYQFWTAIKAVKID